MVVKDSDTDLESSFVESLLQACTSQRTLVHEAHLSEARRWQMLGGEAA